MRSLVSTFAFFQGGPLREIAPAFILWAVGGSCGTRSPGIVVHPRHPDPEPWWLIQVIGVVTGVLGGWLYMQVFSKPQPDPWRSAVPVAASLLGALVASRFATDLYQIARGGSAKGQT
jgi:hypothetical protein